MLVHQRLHVLCKTEGRIKTVTFMGKMINHESLKLWDAGQFLMINGQQIAEQTVNLQGTATDSLPIESMYGILMYIC